MEKYRNRKNRKTRSLKFTLIELLVVIAIIGILMTILLPVLSRSKAMGHRIGCLNNLKQYGIGMHMYYNDWGDGILCGWQYSPGNYWMPRNLDTMWDWPWYWDEIWKIYLNGDEDVIYCPSQKREDFAANTGYTLTFSVGYSDASPYYPGPGWCFSNATERYGKYTNSGINKVALLSNPKLQNCAVMVDTCHQPGTIWFDERGRRAHMQGGNPSGQNSLRFDGSAKWHKLGRQTFWASEEMFPIIER